ncbi:LLM class flavin-dependent oxidoreductase [Pseudonocardia xinjiangensis]|uniref:LLM class flavin-dependent oxidoreductase n=1 Tax=Pseudonocardia xinjiangensis TaxID=75289 RepID=UPI003D93C77C
MDLVRTGVLLPLKAEQWAGADPRELVDLAVRAERAGYDSVWANDTLLGAHIDPLTILAAVAARTERVTLGTAALLPAFRRPVQAAKAIASLDLLAGGRLVLGVGAGFPGRSEPEYAASEVPWPRRFARLDDTVALWRQLWGAEGTTSFTGDVLRLADIPASTRPYRSGGPPIWLAGATPAALARTGRHYDGWLPYPPQPATYAAGLADISTAALAAGRQRDAITPALFATVLLAPDVPSGLRAVDEFCRENYGLPLDVIERIQTIVAGSPEHVAAGLSRFVEAGARHIVLRIAAPGLDGQRDQLDRLADLLLGVRDPVVSPRP